MKRSAKFIFLLTLIGTLFLFSSQARAARTPAGLSKSAPPLQPLAPTWGSNIRQWSAQIALVAHEYGLDPDLIAAVIREESHGDPHVVSYMGAVGLMGVMPRGPGFEFRPSAEALKRPNTNLHWGAAILADIIRQSGGDLYAALAAYNGGWSLVESRVPRLYASSVLHYYGRAVAARSGISPDIATQWTLAVEMRRGHVPVGHAAPGDSLATDLLVLGTSTTASVRTYGGHIVYSDAGRQARAYTVRGYAVPIVSAVPHDSVSYGHSDRLEAPLQARLGEVIEKADSSSLEVLVACLPSLNRLRGRVSTRWYAPSSCPSWHR